MHYLDAGGIPVPEAAGPEAFIGGAHALLPYAYQKAAEHYHWLTPHQMIDGLALGETTPRPLIMVMTFVGFVEGL